MSDILSVVGVDPGIVHTGIVAANFHTAERRISVAYSALAGDAAPAHAGLIRHTCFTLPTAAPTAVFVEAYRERGTSYGTNAPMRELLAEIRRQMPEATIVDNTGVKKVVKPALLKVLGMLKFGQTTHHQDLEAAARILVFGMLKDPVLNEVLADVLLATINGNPWSTRQQVGG